MPRQCILTAAERSALLAFPIEKSELIRLYTFSEQDLSVIKQRRGDANRLGFAVLLCALRYPGQSLSAGERPPDSFLTMVARQIGIDEKVWEQYGEREETRREHLSELRAFLGLTPFGLRQFHQFARWLAELAMQTDKGVVLATALVQELRREKVVLPPINVIERICALAITRANRKIYFWSSFAITALIATAMSRPASRFTVLVNCQRLANDERCDGRKEEPQNQKDFSPSCHGTIP
jgi:Domain of unknown function (DUF4158)